ncbi:DUF6681 family protein [Lacticaseibacillus kribbianus]|uniref:DUF6681 family protein n=1 Tax=Lacticaseibacillus kribbianus TaxID=2926292 RepID=UPI001CD37452|nr:DUF6681 family protein [Lacticaseibacillus kribbianus]
MLTVLDLVNRALSYFNIQDKAKGKAFTIVAFGANFYLLYQALRHLRYVNYRAGGVLFLLAFLVLLYFIVLNFFYYFTDKQVKWDVSPRVEKLLGGNPQAAKAAEAALTQSTTLGASNGLFQEERLLPVAVVVDQPKLDALVQQLRTTGALTENYQGLDAHAIERVVTRTHRPVAAIGGPFELPYFALVQSGKQLVIQGGLNALAPVTLGTITRVGLMPTSAAIKDYQLALAHVFLTGGEVMQPGRHGLIRKDTPYTITAQIAYTVRPEAKPGDTNEN